MSAQRLAALTSARETTACGVKGASRKGRKAGASSPAGSWAMGCAWLCCVLAAPERGTLSTSVTCRRAYDEGVAMGQGVVPLQRPHSGDDMGEHLRKVVDPLRVRQTGRQQAAHNRCRARRARACRAAPGRRPTLAPVRARPAT